MTSFLETPFFYSPKEIFKNRLVLAPMAGITDPPFRKVVWQHGVGLLYSEMISAYGIVYGNEPTMHMLRSCISDFPVNVQLFGEDPLVLADAAKICEDEGVRMIDINMGCPVKKVCRKGGGAALLSDISKCGVIVEMVRKRITIPLSVKIRSGLRSDLINAEAIAKILEESGADMIAVHPRTKVQFFSGAADWDVIGMVKNAVSIPVIGNGDVSSREKVLQMFSYTSCDLVMLGRAIQGAPWLFQEILEGRSPGEKEKKEIVLRHLEYVVDAYGEKKGIKRFRKHLMWYSKGSRQGSLVRQQSSGLDTKTSMIKAINELWKFTVT